MSKLETPQSGVKTYGRLLSYLRPYSFIFLLSTVGYVVFASSAALLASLMGDATRAVETNDERLMIFVPLAVVAVYLVRGISGFIGDYFMAKVSLNVVHDLRLQLFNGLTVMPGEFFDDNNSGHLISRITYNVSQVTESITNAIKIMIREGAMVIALFAYMFYQNWEMTLVFVAIAPFIALLVGLVGKRLRRLANRIQVSMGDITHTTSEMISGYKVMRSFGGEKYECKRFDKASANNRTQNLKMASTAAANTAVMQLIVAAALALVMYLAMSFMGGSGSAEPFIVYITTAGLIPKPVRQLSSVYGKLQKGIAAAEDIFSQLDIQPEVDQGQYSVRRVEGHLRIEAMNFAYNEAEGNVLHNINLDIPAGKTVALVGRSGSGKTTLASLIPRFYRHQEGCILLDGKPLEEYQLSCLRQQIALVNQDVVLFNDSLKNNIAYGDLSYRSDTEIEQAAKAAHALEFITEQPEGMETLVGEDGARLSGGQRQRIAIARALLKDAPLLILDEATSALDTESERKIKDALDKVMENRTTLVIAHRLSTIENADLIVVMDQGKIVEKGKHADLIAQDGAYAKLHAMQFGESESS